MGGRQLRHLRVFISKVREGVSTHCQREMHNSFWTKKREKRNEGRKWLRWPFGRFFCHVQMGMHLRPGTGSPFGYIALAGDTYIWWTDRTGSRTSIRREGGNYCCTAIGFRWALALAFYWLFGASSDVVKSLIRPSLKIAYVIRLNPFQTRSSLIAIFISWPLITIIATLFICFLFYAKQDAFYSIAIKYLDVLAPIRTS